VILADTSIWIDFLRQSTPSINDRMMLHLEEGELITISAIFGELLQGVKSEAEHKIILEFWNDTPKIQEQELFIEAGKLSAKYKLSSIGVGLIDCYILIGAITYGHELWTLDKKLMAAYEKIS
jgi:predicted nucleic acid-binding protein